ncbi:Ca2+-dependent phosphoinositide-specific phospholipase C [Spirosoma endbachense]|uniref:1-phosphatidylinositol phosphodiesterase n=1 Tax=Spirosoma endbachense TaxID=2666025 RepID=A0A6P1W845_9BACT|nr:Ca2+-dependent phosphoinositide-specific phospholipase C [Spirosoma endbachense]QHW00190.1 hypothetical protein GJR95_36515 [Spirosoma endbachense]
MSNYQNLPYQSVTFKGSHNSYDRDESLYDQLVFHPDKPYNCGCRGVELDIWRHSDDPGTGLFTVSHSGGGGPDLSTYLASLLSWHDTNPDHDPVWVTLDIKSSNGDKTTFPGQIDGYLTSYFRTSLIFNPILLYTSKSRSLCENVELTGWPTLGDMRNRFIFCLSGNEDWKSYYANTNQQGCLCFADMDRPDDESNPDVPTTGSRVVINMHIYSDDHDKWAQSIPAYAAKNLLVRVYIANGEDLWNNAQAAGASLIATDKVSNYSWAEVSNDAPFAQRNSYQVVSQRQVTEASQQLIRLLSKDTE